MSSVPDIVYKHRFTPLQEFMADALRPTDVQAFLDTVLRINRTSLLRLASSPIHVAWGLAMLGREDLDFEFLPTSSCRRKRRRVHVDAPLATAVQPWRVWRPNTVTLHGMRVRACETVGC